MLKDHYLVEDYDLTIEHLEALLKTNLQIQQCAANADFIHMQQLKDQLDRSIKILEALSNKKLKRDEFELNNHLLYQRNGWVKS